MSQRPALLLYPAALAGFVAIFFYAIRRERRSQAVLRNLQDTIEHDATRSQAIYRLLKKQRRVLHQFSDNLLPVPKGVEKSAS